MARALVRASLVMALISGWLQPASWLGTGHRSLCRHGNWFMNRASGGVTVSCGGEGLGPAERAVTGPAGLLFGRPLDLNQAAVHELTVIPGIGPIRAQAIATARQERSFSTVDDLVRAHGIGRGTLARVQGWVRVGDTTAKEP